MKGKTEMTTLSGQFQNLKILETEPQLIPLTHIHDHSLSWLGTGTSIKSGRVKELHKLLRKA
jgi:hypothetical protein